MAKTLKYFFLHCAATTANPELGGADVRKWHTDPVDKGGRGWKVPGYSMVIRTNGTIDSLVKYDENQFVESWEITNGAAGYNDCSRHVCYIGGLDAHGKAKDTRTPQQKQVLADMMKRAVAAHPDIKILGHYQIQPAKPFCPGFDVPAFCRSIGIPEKNIYKG